MQASTSWADVAFSSSERDRHLGIGPVSQLDTWPVVSPVNASRRPSRDAAHHSGSGRLARPSPWGTFTSYSLPAFLAHSELGQKQPSRPSGRCGCTSFDSGRGHGRDRPIRVASNVDLLGYRQSIIDLD